MIKCSREQQRTCMNMDYHYTDKEDITGAGVSRKKIQQTICLHFCVLYKRNNGKIICMNEFKVHKQVLETFPQVNVLV